MSRSLDAITKIWQALGEMPMNPSVRAVYEAASEAPLCASDVLEARLDREPWSGKLHAQTRLALAEQIIRSLATEHVIPSTAKALCESYFAVTK